MYMYMYMYVIVCIVILPYKLTITIFLFFYYICYCFVLNSFFVLTTCKSGQLMIRRVLAGSCMKMYAVYERAFPFTLCNRCFLEWLAVFGDEHYETLAGWLSYIWC